MVRTEEGQEVRTRECGCPEWAIRCVHIDDEDETIIHLGDVTKFKDVPFPYRYVIRVWTKHRWTDNDGGWESLTHPICPPPTNSYEEALEIFRAAEEQLLRDRQW